MAIAIDAVSTQVAQGGSSTLTINHTCSGYSRALFAMVGVTGGNYITGVTYNSVAMTQIASTFIETVNYYIYVYYLANPDTGQHALTASASQSASIWLEGASYTNVSSSIPDAYAVNNSYSGTTSYSNTVTTIASGCWVGMYAVNYSSDDYFTAGAGTTMRTTISSIRTYVDSNSAVIPAGNKTLTVQTVAQRNAATIIFSFAPIPETTSSTSTSSTTSSTTSTTSSTSSTTTVTPAYVPVPIKPSVFLYNRIPILETKRTTIDI